VAHFARKQFVTLFGLLPAGYVDENAEHDAVSYADIGTLAPRRNPPDQISNQDAKIYFITADQRSGRGERGSHPVAICRVDVFRKIFKSDKRRDGDAPQTIPFLVHRQLVVVNVPGPESDAGSIDREAQVGVAPSGRLVCYVLQDT
jgi:hypothetical protein